MPSILKNFCSGLRSLHQTDTIERLYAAMGVVRPPSSIATISASP